jgi:solute carrier family 10 (sodium/bile acid cotransporter), member 7
MIRAFLWLREKMVLNNSMKRYLPDRFITGLLLMILSAWLFPGFGSDLGPFSIGNIIDAGVMLIFFFYGLKLDPERLLMGMSNWKLHIAIQLTTFLVFPILVLPFYPIFAGSSLYIYWTGIFFLAALPSTVSSSVVMVSLAGGNVPGAIFNASISGIIGIVMTPVWMGILLTSDTHEFDFIEVLLRLTVQIIVPVIAGLLLHPVFSFQVKRYGKKLARFDKLVILLIVYESFSNSFVSGMFSSVNWITLLILSVTVVFMFFAVYGFTGFLARKMQFTREDRITLQFAGSKKSLVHGSVFSNVMFAGVGGVGIYLLPIMLYHAFQLFYVSIAARRMQSRPE